MWRIKLFFSSINKIFSLPFIISFSLILLFVVLFIATRPFAIPTISILGIDNEVHIVKSSDKISYGFLPYWSISDYVQNFDYITDISYFSLYLNNDGTVLKINEEGNTDPSYNNYRNSSKLKKIFSTASKYGVRTHLTISQHVDEDIIYFLNCGEVCWQRSYTELKNEVDFLNVQGINFDFEYVGYLSDFDNLDLLYTQYIEYISKKFKAQNSNFTISVSTYGNAAKKHRLMNIPSLSSSTYIDYLFIMAYDFYSVTSASAGPHSPLTGAEVFSYDLTTMLQDYLQVSSAQKLVLGLPFYGYNWVVNSDIKYASRVPGNDYTGYSVSQYYTHILDNISSKAIRPEWDEVSQTPYYTYYSSTGVLRQVFYENAQSLSLKTSLAKSNKLKGIGIWALGYDGGSKDLQKVFTNYLLN